MSLMTKAMTEARRRSLGLLDQAKAGFSLGAMTGGVSSAGGLDALSRNTNNMALHSEQLRHFQGYPYAIIRLIANRIAGQPLRVARVVPAGERNERSKRGRRARRRMENFRLKHLPRVPRIIKEQVGRAEILEDHPLLEIFRRPNALMVRYTMMFVTIAALELTGRAYWWFMEDEETGRMQIWPIPPSWVEPRHTELELYAEWEIRPSGVGESYVVPGSQIAYFYYPDPSNPLGAISPLQALAKTVVADESIEEANRRAFTNGLNPGLAVIVGQWPEAAAAGITTQAVLTKDQRNVIINTLKQQYRGVINNEEPLILDGLIKDVKKITNAPREMDFLNSSTVTKGRLAQGWGVNPISMGEIEGANRASSATADQHLCDNVINPRVEMFSQILTTFLAPRLSKDSEEVVVYIEAAHSVDQDYDLAVEMAMVSVGAMSRNEMRHRHGFPPVEDGDSAFVGGIEIPIVVDPSYDGKSSRRRPRPNRPVPSAKRGECLADRLGEKGQVAIWEKQSASLELTYERSLRKKFVALGEELRKSLESAIGADGEPTRGLIEQSVHSSEWTDELLATARPHIEEACLTGAVLEWELHKGAAHHRSAKGDRLRVSMDQLPKSIRGQVRGLVSDLLEAASWKDVIPSIREALYRAVNQEAKTGKRGRELAKAAVNRVLGVNAASKRAAAVARTDTTAGLNGGQEASRKTLAKLGVIRSKRWVATLDDVTRSNHRHANGQEVGASESFDLAGHVCSYPGDPRLPIKERINCRCVVISRRE